jgi:hypothetical protein
MAKLSTHFGPHIGSLNIYVGFFNVGSGKFTTFNDTETEFAGSYQIFLTAGAFNIRILLTHNNPDATTGPCEITLNESVDTTAKYEVHGEKLMIATTLNETPVAIYLNNGGTQIDSISGHNIWIGQGGTV